MAKQKIALVMMTLMGVLVSCDSKVDAPSEKQVTTDTINILNSERDIGGLGFYDLDSDTIPNQIKKASLSVLEIRVLAKGSDQFIKTVDISSRDNIQDLRKRIKMLPNDNFDEQDKIILNRQVDICTQTPDKECSITFDIRRGTAFLTGQGQTLVTNAHVIDSYFKALQTFDEKLQISDLITTKKALRIFLFNSTGELIADPYIDKMTLDKIPDLTQVAKYRNSFYAEDSDYVFINISKVIGTPLKVSKLDVSKTKRVFTLGYPACTGCTPQAEIEDPLDWKDRGAGLNSNGKGLKFSFGLLKDADDARTFFGIKTESFKTWKTSEMLFYTADSNHGSSGGPILDESGDVIGIHTGGLSKIINEELNRISRGVLMPHP